MILIQNTHVVHADYARDFEIKANYLCTGSDELISM
jgi:hypothetical protein